LQDILNQIPDCEGSIFTLKTESVLASDVELNRLLWNYWKELHLSKLYS